MPRRDEDDDEINSQDRPFKRQRVSSWSPNRSAERYADKEDRHVHRGGSHSSRHEMRGGVTFRQKEDRRHARVEHRSKMEEDEDENENGNSREDRNTYRRHERSEHRDTDEDHDRSGSHTQYKRHRRSRSDSSTRDYRNSGRSQDKQGASARDRQKPDDGRQDRDRADRRHKHRERERDHDRDRDYDHDRERDQHRDRRDRENNHRHRSRHHRRRSRSRSHSPSKSPRPHQRSKAPLPSQNDAFTTSSNPTNDALDKPVEKQKANFANTGKLAAASNTIQTGNQTIVLKYHEPPEARKPPSTQPWRMYIFKPQATPAGNGQGAAAAAADEILETIPLSTQTCWLFGREPAVADIHTQHPTCSSQHAVLQFRYLERRTEYGDRKGRVKPYLLDLESTHGTRLNGERIPAAKYVELRDGDVVRLGESTREYVLQLPPA